MFILTGVALLLGLVLAYLVRILFIFPHTIKNNFMAPNFPAGKKVYIIPSVKTSELSIGDMVLVKHPLNNTVFVSRIAARPGDRVEIRNKVLIRNGNSIENSKKFNFSDKRTAFPEEFSKRDNMSEIIVKEDTFFVLADNRDEGLDSRQLGLISATFITGKILF